MSSPSAKPMVTHWRVALVLAGATGIASLLVIPYALALTAEPMRTLGLPPALAIALSGVQSTLLAFGLAWSGLRLGEPLGLGAPLVRAWTERQAPPQNTRWSLAVVVGVLAGGAIIALDTWLFARLLSPAAAAALQRALEAHHPTRWQGALASFYGGIAEEVQLRLFLMTLVAWSLAKLTRSRSAAVFAAANIVAALAFGAGHLPAAARVFGSLSAWVVVRTLTLNASAGLAFGELYRRYGIEHAMVGHFTADLVLHVIIGG